MRISWRRLALVAAVAIPLAAVGGVLWTVSRDLSSYQARLTDQIRKVTGRELMARVPLGIRLGTQPALVAEGITLSNAPWGTRPELARVRKITLFLDPASLLLGEAKVGRILLEGADIVVERNDVGDSNLEMLPPPDGSGPHPGENKSLRLKPNPAFPWIGTIEVKDSVLTVREGITRQPTVLEIAAGTVKASSANTPLQLVARLGAPHAAAIELTGQAGTFDGWLRGLPGNIDVKGKLGEGQIAIKGSVGSKGTNLQVTSDGPDLAVLGPYVGLSLPGGGPYSLAAKTLTVRNSLKVEMTSLKVGSSELSGEAIFRPDRHGTPTATVNIDANRIDFGDFKRAPAAAPVAAPAAAAAPIPPQRLVPTMPFSANWLGRSNLSLNARIGEVHGLQGKVQNASVTLSSSDKRFSFRGAATVGGGSAGFDLIYDPTGRVGQATLTATANRVAVQDLSTVLGLDLGVRDAVADIDLRLRGGGRTTRDALNTATGTIEIALAKGSWPADSLQGFPADTVKLLGKADPGVAFNCAAGRFEVSGGVASLRRLVVDTPTATLVGGGYVHLRSEGWEFILAPEARDNRNIGLAAPLRIKGGSGRTTTGALDPSLTRLIVPGGTVPSLVGQLGQAARQPNVNPCSVLAPRVDGLRPGLRAQMPTPPVVERRDRTVRRPPAQR